MDNAWYAMALESAKNMAVLTGNSKDAEEWNAKLQSIKANFDKTFWQEGYYRSSGYEGEIDDRGHGLAVVAGLSSEDYWPQVKDVLAREFHASPYTEKYVLESFFIRNEADAGLKRMKDRYWPW